MSSTSKRVALFGATGGSGKLLLKLLVAAGHRVAVLVRTPAKLGEYAQHERVEVIEGDATAEADVRRTMAGAEVVYSTLGNVPRAKTMVMERAFTTIVETAAGAKEKPRCVFVTTVGVGPTSWVVWFFLSLFVGFQVIRDYERADKCVREAEGGKCVLVRPNELTDKPAKGYIASDSGAWQASVSRQDLAQFLFDLLEEEKYDGRAVQLTS